MFEHLWVFRKEKKVLLTVLKAWLMPFQYTRRLKGRRNYRLLWFMNIVSIFCLGTSIGYFANGDWKFGIWQLLLAVLNALLYMDTYLAAVCMFIFEEELNENLNKAVHKASEKEGAGESGDEPSS